jgi:hypothetical protein
MDREKTHIRRDQIRVVPISETKSGRWHNIDPHDAPYALCIFQDEHAAPENVAVLALDREVSPDEAWSEYERAGTDYRVVD